MIIANRNPVFWACLMSFWLVSSSGFGDMIDDFDDLKDELKKPSVKQPSSKQPTKSDIKNDIQIDQSEAGNSNSGQKSPSQEPVGKSPAKNTKTVADDVRKRLPINLKSDGEAIYSRDGGTVYLTKNVRISQGNLFFRSDEAKAHFVNVNGEDIVQKVVITGNVRLAKHALDPTKVVKAKGNQAFFYNDRNLVELIGNAQLWQGGHLIKGKKITYDLNTSIVKVDRAEGVVQPGEQ